MHRRSNATGLPGAALAPSEASCGRVPDWTRGARCVKVTGYASERPTAGFGLETSAPPKSPPWKSLAEMKFGDRLRQAREARGVTIDDVFQETHIARRYLEALDRSDVSVLPGGIFDKGYIRSYARFVGVDPEPIVSAYEVAKRRSSPAQEDAPDRMLQEIAIQANRQSGPRKRPPIPVGAAAGLAAILLAILAGVWLFLADETVEEEPQEASISERAPESQAELPSPVVEMPASEATTSETPPDDVPAPSGANSVSAHQLTVAEAGLGTGVVEHALTGRSDRFAEGTRVFFWNRVLNGEQGMVLRHIWKLGDEIVMNSELVIGGPHWRTYSSYTLPPGSTGDWTLEAIGPDGRVLFHTEFTCVEAPDLETRTKPVFGDDHQQGGSS